MFDFFLYPLHFMDGREQPELPGLFTASAPRRSERHRAGDQLAALLTPAAGAPRAEGLAECFQLLASAYYATGGTVTTAMRAAVERLNEALLAKRVQPGSESGAALVLNLAVLRGSLVYFAHAGVTHSYLFSSSGAQDHTELHNAGSGLGVTRAPNLRLFQSSVEAGDMLLFSPQPPAHWTVAALQPGARPESEELLERLLNPGATNLRAALLRLEAGSGQAQRVTRQAVPVQSPAPERAPAAAPQVSTQVRPAAPVTVQPAAPAPAPMPSAPEPKPGGAPEDDDLVGGIYLSGERLLSEERPGSARERRAAALRARPGLKDRMAGWFARRTARPARPAPAASLDDVDTEAAETFAPPLTTPPPMGRPKTPNRAWARSAAGMVRNVQTVQQGAQRGLARFLPRLAPGPAAQPIAISTTALLLIAFAVPVMIVAIATTVYLQAGVGEERVAFLQQARIYADQAADQDDPALRRNAWEQTMYWIKKAEAYGSDEESQALREQAQAALDSMDGIVRLSLVPAFSGILGNTVNITRMAASGNDLYLLDSAQGRVLRMILSGRGYEFDPNFNCGPGPAGNKIISPLVGMAVLPPNNDKDALLMAVDGAGNLLYCRENEAPLVATLTPPDNNWGVISSMSLSDGNLHLVDIPNNGVYRYDGAQYTFGGKARLFFGDIAPGLSDVIDMTAYLDDLYLLHADGTMTVCTWSDFESSPTRCTDPASYGSAREPGAFRNFPEARFLQMATTQPPDPSLFILDTSGPAIYHFSLRLNLQRQLRQDTASEFSLPNKTATAFAISPARVVFMAFGNQVFFGPLP